MKNIHKKIITLLLTVTVMLGCIYVPSTASEAQEQIPSESTSAGESMGNIGNGEIIGEIPETEIEEVVPTYYDYIAPRYNSEISSFDKYSDIRYFIDIGSNMRYNNLEVSYASTLDINLKNYINNTVPYSDVVTVPLIFSVSEPAETVLYTDYASAQFGEILLSLTAYVDKKAVESEVVTIYVLNTSNGVYVSSIGRIETYYEYICDLYNNSVISEEEFSYAELSITSSGISYSAGEYSAEEINLMLGEKNGEKATFKYYDQNLKMLKTNEKQTVFNIMMNKGSESAENETLLPMVTPNIVVMYAPKTKVVYDVTFTSDAIRITGTVTWTDVYRQNYYHPMVGVKIVLMSRVGTINSALVQSYTNGNGNFSLIYRPPSGIPENGYNIFLRLTASDSNSTVRSTSGTYREAYYLDTPVVQGVKENRQGITYEKSETNDVRALQIFQAMYVGFWYYDRMVGTNNHTIRVFYPGAGDNSYSSFIQNSIDIYMTHFCNWDTILHEFGHQAQWRINAYYNIGLEHYMEENLIESYGKTQGAHVAWNEGFAQYFGQASQTYFNDNRINISQIYTAADKSKSQASYPRTSSVNRKYNFPSTDSFIFGRGEGNEYAIANVMLQLIWNDKFNLTDQGLWELLVWDEVSADSKVDTFSEFMQKLYAIVPNYLISDIGVLLEENNIADKPLREYPAGTPLPVLQSISNAPALYWEKANVKDNIDRVDDDGNIIENIMPYSFKIVFWDENFNQVYTSGILETDYMTSPLQTAYTQWGEILNKWKQSVPQEEWNIPETQKMEVYYWSIATYQIYNPDLGHYIEDENWLQTGPYYSSFVKFVISERIQNMTEYETAYNDTLAEGGEEWFKFTVPATGNYTFYSLNSPDIKASLYLGELGIEFYTMQSDSDDGEGLNFSITEFMYANEVFYLKVTGETRTNVGDIYIYIRQEE